MIIISLLVSILVLFYAYLTRNFNYWKKRGVEYVKPWPVFGSSVKLVTFTRSIGEYLSDLYFSTKSPFLGFFIGDRPVLLVKDKDMLQSILVKDFNYFYDRIVGQNQTKDPMGANILFCSKNPDWRNIRTKVTMLFSTGKLKIMFNLINEVGIDLIKYMDQNVKNGESVNTKELIGKYSADVITSCAFGIKSNCFDYENAAFNSFAKRIFIFDWNQGIQMSSSFLMPTFFNMFGMTFIDPAAGTFFVDTFTNVIREREESGKTRNDLIDILIKIKKENMEDNANKIDEIKLMAQLAQFFIAGFETSSSAISFALYELAKNQDVQGKLRSVIMNTLEKHGEFTYENIQEMTYLKYVVKETMRKYPVLPYLDRKAMMDYKLPNSDLVIEKGTHIFIPVMGLQYDPEYFPDPERFYPERFDGENKKNLAFTYLAFGDGPRNCIGERFGYLSIEVGLVNLLSKYKVEPTAETPNKIVFNSKAFLLHTMDGIPLKYSRL